MRVPFCYNGLMKKRSWPQERLLGAVEKSTSFRQVLKSIGLKPAGGNYAQVKKYVRELKLDTSHFKGKGWNKGLHFEFVPKIPLKNILVANSSFQSYKLKKRLIQEGIKTPQCEECGWTRRSDDGRLPLELDHINGNALDNRLENLRILCPNCHSLKPTHRGCNRKRKL